MIRNLSDFRDAAERDVIKLVSKDNQTSRSSSPNMNALRLFCSWFASKDVKTKEERKQKRLLSKVLAFEKHKVCCYRKL